MYWNSSKNNEHIHVAPATMTNQDEEHKFIDLQIKGGVMGVFIYDRLMKVEKRLIHSRS